MAEEPNQKKVGGRTVVIVLGLICVILAAGLVGVLAIYFYQAASNSAEIEELKAENTNLKGNQTTLIQQLSTLQTSLSQARNEIESKNAEIADFNEAYNSLLNLLYLNASQTLLNQPVQIDAGANTTVFNDYIQYAGYVTVQIASSSNTTYAQVLYTYSGFYFDDLVVVGESGTAAFAVLPGPIEIRIGNTETASSVNATVAVTYVF